MKDEFEKKTEKIIIKTNQQTKLNLEWLAAQSGMNTSTYLRTLINDNFKKATEKQTDEPDDVIPTKPLTVDLLLTEQELEHLNLLAVKAEKPKENVIRDFIRDGKVITLPFFDREKDIKEFISEINKMNNCLVNAEQSELQPLIEELNKMIYEYTRQELVAQHRMQSAIKKVLRKEQ